MITILYDSGSMDISGQRGRVRIIKAHSGIAVLRDSLYDVPSTIDYYRSHPALPDNWDTPINKYGTTAALAWLHDLEGYTPAYSERANEMTIALAAVISGITTRGIRLAAARGYIPGARKAGRDWLIPYSGLSHYLDNRPKRGRKPA